MSLVVIELPGGKRTQVEEKGATIGRAGAEIVIDDPLVAERHARITFSAGKWHIEDLKTELGVVIHDAKITAPMELRSGMRFAIGEHKFEISIPVRLPTPAAKPVAPPAAAKPTVATLDAFQTSEPDNEPTRISLIPKPADLVAAEKAEAPKPLAPPPAPRPASTGDTGRFTLPKPAAADATKPAADAAKPLTTDTAKFAPLSSGPKPPTNDTAKVAPLTSSTPPTNATPPNDASKDPPPTNEASDNTAKLTPPKQDPPPTNQAAVAEDIEPEPPFAPEKSEPPLAPKSEPLKPTVSEPARAAPDARAALPPLPPEDPPLQRPTGLLDRDPIERAKTIAGLVSAVFLIATWTYAFSTVKVGPAPPPPEPASAPASQPVAQEAAPEPTPIPPPTPYRIYAGKRAEIERAIELNPLVLKDADTAALYDRLYTELYKIDAAAKKAKKKRTKPLEDRLRDIEVFERTGPIVDALHEKLSL